MYCVTVKAPEQRSRKIPQQIWIADAHRGDGKRFVVRADERLTTFVELESAIRAISAKSTQSAV